MLDAEDIHSTPKPNERAIMTYVSSYYHAFSSSAQAEQAAKRIGKVLNVNQENEKMMADYETMASNLLEWIRQTMPWLQDRSQDDTLQATQNRLEEFRQYGTVTKPPKTDEKAKLETHFHTLQTKLRLSNRPAYVPSEGKLVSDINAAWKSLEEAEKAYEEYLRQELRRLQRLELLASKFDSKAKKVEAWAAGKDAALMATDDIESSNLAEIMALQKIHETFQSDIEAENNRVGQLEALAQELSDYHYYHADVVNARMQSIKDTAAHLGQLAEARSQRIQEAIERQQQLDELRLNFAKKAAAFNNWMDNTMDDLQDAFVCSSTEEAEQLQNELEGFKAGPLQEASANYDELNGFVTTMAELGSTDNPYTTLTPTLVYDKWCNVLDAVPAREQSLAEEMEKQQMNEQLRLAFAERANALADYIQQRGSELAEQSMQALGTMEDQQEALVAFEAETLSHQPEVEGAEEVHRQTQAALIFDNKHAHVSMEGLRANWTALLQSIQRAKNEMENQILIRDSKGLNEEQIKEYRQSFNHFDRDSSGMLDKNEYRACLLSLGYKLGADPTNDPEFDKLWAEIDPNETGYVSFEAFLAFMSKTVVDQDTADQVLESFKVLAGDKPYITADELRRELPPEQAEYCISRMIPYGGEGAPEGALDYMSFSSALYGQSEL
jgi:actinin alpha